MGIQEELWSLNSKERTVLWWKCQGYNYDVIGNKLGYGRDNITKIMSGVYKKLGLADKEIHWTERKKILDELYCRKVFE